MSVSAVMKCGVAVPTCCLHACVCAPLATYQPQHLASLVQAMMWAVASVLNMLPYVYYSVPVVSIFFVLVE
jgi:hypothetical protein